MFLDTTDRLRVGDELLALNELPGWLRKRLPEGSRLKVNLLIENASRRDRASVVLAALRPWNADSVRVALAGELAQPPRPTGGAFRRPFLHRPVPDERLGPGAVLLQIVVDENGVPLRVETARGPTTLTLEAVRVAWDTHYNLSVRRTAPSTWIISDLVVFPRR